MKGDHRVLAPVLLNRGEYDPLIDSPWVQWWHPFTEAGYSRKYADADPTSLWHLWTGQRTACGREIGSTHHVWSSRVSEAEACRTCWAAWGR
jgi:hypothetical protein